MSSPLSQFEIHDIFQLSLLGHDISFTNSALWMMVTVSMASIILGISVFRLAIIPGRLQVSAEFLYRSVRDMVKENAGSEGLFYFPFIFALFVFLCFGNLLGLIPGSFTFTSHLSLTFPVALFIFCVVTLIGFMRHGLHFLSLFFPQGAPWWMAFFLVPVELISYFSRPISLSVRLFANMLVGHVLLKVIAGFVVSLGLFGFLPFAGLVLITLLEIMVALIQAYVFAILTCVYLHDALHLH